MDDTWVHAAHMYPALEKQGEVYQYLTTTEYKFPYHRGAHVIDMECPLKTPHMEQKVVE